MEKGVRYIYSLTSWSTQSILTQKPDFNHLRWQPIADRNEWPKPYTTIRRFLSEHVGG